MGHIPDDKNFDEWMNSSAENWSEPQKPEAPPEQDKQPTDRWGSPLSPKEALNDGNRWGSEPIEPSTTRTAKRNNKVGCQWWVILILVLISLCICACPTYLILRLFNVI
jgi:hypothetical protein